MPRALTLKTARRVCQECSGGDTKAVLWCPSDGVHSTACELWPFRLGLIPAKVAKKYTPALVTPEAMPGANVNLDRLPGTPRAAASYFRERTTAA